MRYSPEVGRILMSIMLPILAKDSEFKRSLAYFGIGENETKSHYDFERSHLIAAAGPFTADEVMKVAPLG